MKKRFGAILLAVSMVLQTAAPMYAEEVTTEVIDQEGMILDAVELAADDETQDDVSIDNGEDTADAFAETAEEAGEDMAAEGEEDPFAGLIEDEEDGNDGSILDEEISAQALIGNAGDEFVISTASTSGRARLRIAFAVNDNEYFGSRLSGNAKVFYEALKVGNWNYSKDIVEEELGQTVGQYELAVSLATAYTYDGTSEGANLAISTMWQDIQAAFSAYMADYPETGFWLRSSGYSIKANTNFVGAIKNVSLVTYERWKGAKDSLSSLQNKLDADEQEISNLFTEGMTVTEKQRIVSNYICSKAVYPVLGEGSDDPEWFTPYGMYNKGYIVCEGYAKLFKIFCDRLQLSNTILVTGKSYSSEGYAGDHMWNLTKADDGWYYVDVTWNDNSDNTLDYYMFAGSNSKGYQLTVGEEHVADTNANFPTPEETMYHEWKLSSSSLKNCEVGGEKTYSCPLHERIYPYNRTEQETKTESIGPSNHTWDEGTITKTATYYETGTMHYNCTVCSQTKEETIPVVSKPTHTISYSFVSSDGSTLPAEVLSLLPVDSELHELSSTVALKQPTATSVRPEGSHVVWTFSGYSNVTDNTVTIADEDMVITGTWTVREDPKYSLSYTFVSPTDTENLPLEVTALTPVDEQTKYYKGDIVTVQLPSDSFILLGEGEDTFAWKFEGYKIGSEQVTGNTVTMPSADTVITGVWKKVLPTNWDQGEVITAATCSAKGEKRFYCTDEGFEQVYKTEEIPIDSSNHVQIVTDHAVEATVTTTGLTEGQHCADCGTVIVAQTEIPKVAHVHVIVIDAAVAATCTSTGLTAGSHCNDCGVVIKARTTTPVLGHSYGAWRTTKTATYYETGLQTRSCVRCGKTESRTVAQLPNPMKITVNKTSFNWTGKAQKPKVKSVTVNGKKLKSKEYKVTYSNNKNVGTGTVTVTGKKQYSSYKAIVTFKINPPKAKISSAKSKKAGTVVLSWKKIGGVAGYEIQYAGMTIRVSGSSYTFAGLTSKQKVSFKVRAYAYVDGAMQYGAWSSAKSCKVK